MKYSKISNLNKGLLGGLLVVVSSVANAGQVEAISDGSLATISKDGKTVALSAGAMLPENGTVMVTKAGKVILENSKRCRVELVYPKTEKTTNVMTIKDLEKIDCVPGTLVAAGGGATAAAVGTGAAAVGAGSAAVGIGLAAKAAIVLGAAAVIKEVADDDNDASPAN